MNFGVSSRTWPKLQQQHRRAGSMQIGKRILDQAQTTHFIKDMQQLGLAGVVIAFDRPLQQQYRLCRAQFRIYIFCHFLTNGGKKTFFFPPFRANSLAIPNPLKLARHGHLFDLFVCLSI